MLELGKRQSLTVVKTVDFGVYLSEGEGAGEEVLLPKKEVPEGTKTGDQLEVFLYKDSKDRLIATREEPAIQLGEVALLKVAETGKIGAFLDWGLPKVLLLPFREQTRKGGTGGRVPGGPLHRQEQPSLRDHEGVSLSKKRISL